MTLAPRLTALDERVLSAVTASGSSVLTIACQVYPPPAPPTASERREVFEILRGLERVGRVVEVDGLWYPR